MANEFERTRLERLDRNAGVIRRVRTVGWKAAYRHHEQEERAKNAAESKARVPFPSRLGLEPDKLQ